MMKLPITISTLLAPFLLVLPTSARNAHVYTSDSFHPDFSADSVSETVSPLAARLILSQRLGIAEYHSLSDADDEALRVVNKLGRQQQPLFGEAAEEEGRRKAILIVESVQVDELNDVAVDPIFKIQDTPAADKNTQLFDDMITQYEHRTSARDHSTACAPFDSSYLDRHAGIVSESKYDSDCLTVIRGKILSDPSTAGTKPSHFLLENYLRAARISNADLTAIFIEPESSSASNSGNSKRSTASSWGIYTVPTKRSPQIIGGIVDDIKDAITGSNEEHGTEDPPKPPSVNEIASAIQASSSSSSGSASSTGISATSSPTPPVGILPACYTSASECESATNSCSGHGNCTLKYDLTKNKENRQDRPGSGASTKTKCYSCACNVDVKQLASGGTKTTRWAGPACQKKDVSAAFWLLAGFSVLLVGAVTWAVVLLYRMGAEELPSVIGAGVAGPRAK